MHDNTKFGYMLPQCLIKLCHLEVLWEVQLHIIEEIEWVLSYFERVDYYYFVLRFRYLELHLALPIL